MLQSTLKFTETFTKCFESRPKACEWKCARSSGQPDSDDDVDPPAPCPVPVQGPRHPHHSGCHFVHPQSAQSHFGQCRSHHLFPTLRPGTTFTQFTRLSAGTGKIDFNLFWPILPKLSEGFYKYRIFSRRFS